MQKMSFHSLEDLIDYEFSEALKHPIPSFDAPFLDRESRVHNWHNHIVTRYKEFWNELTERERKMLFIQAVEDASNEEWD